MTFGDSSFEFERQTKCLLFDFLHSILSSLGQIIGRHSLKIFISFMLFLSYIYSLKSLLVGHSNRLWGQMWLYSASFLFYFFPL